jgi:hypothetical protein
MSAHATVVQAFFLDPLVRGRHASVQTVTAFRDAGLLLLGFAAKRVGNPPSTLDPFGWPRTRRLSVA